VRDAACSVENRVSLVVMRCANVYRAKRRCPLQYRITVCRTSFISLKTTNQEMPSSESGLTLSLLPYAVGAGEHGSPGVVATVPPTAIVPKVFGNTKEAAVCALAESTERRETPGGGEQQSGRRRNKISETFRSGHQAALSCIRVSEHVSCLSSGCQENLSFVLANGLASSGRLDFRWRGCMLAYSVSGRN